MRAYLKFAAISAIVLFLRAPLADAQVEQAREYEFSVAPGPLNAAIDSLSQQSGTAILTRSELIEGLRTTGFSGRLSMAEALEQLVAPFGLEAQPIGEAFMIGRRDATPQPEAPSPPRPHRDSRREPPLQQAPTIIVYGYRTSNAAAINDKFSATAILDGVNQDTITLLPDLTVSDVARRIPGIASIPENGTSTNRHIQTSQNVLIRGLDANYSQTTLDNLPFAAASESNRAANLSLFPPTAISRVEAVKTLSSDLDPHGLTGRLNLQTASALARAEPFNALRFSVGQNSTAGKVLDPQAPNLRADALLQRLIGASTGISLAASYEHFYATSRDERPGGATDTYLFYSPDPSILDPVDQFADSDGLPAPRRNQLYLFENEQERSSALAKLEWAGEHGASFSLTGGLFWQREGEVRHEHLVVAAQTPRPVDRTSTTGTWQLGRVEAGYVRQPETTLTGLINLRASYPQGEFGELEIAGSVSRADVDVTRHMSKFATSQDGSVSAWDMPFSYTLNSDGVSLDISDPARANDAAAYTNSYIREWSEDVVQDLFYGEARYRFTPNPVRHNWQVETGVSLTYRRQAFDREYVEGDIFAVEGCTELDVRDCPLARFSEYVETRRFATTDPDVDFLLVNDQAARAAWIAQGRPMTVDRTDDSIRADYRLSETYIAAWSRLFYEVETWRVEAGLRYDRAEADTSFFLRDLRLPSDPDSAQYLPEARSAQYDFLLPSLLVQWTLSDDLILRGAATRAIGRPNISDLTIPEIIGVSDTSGEVPIRRGNPDLRPVLSNNLDLSVEYYFDERRSLASLALFHKDVTDLIFLQNSRVSNFELDGDLVTANILQPVNLTDASVYGLEAALRLDLAGHVPSPWNGFVVETNLTWIGSEFTLYDTNGTPRDPGGWINQPDLIFNFQLSYEQGRFGGNIAFKHVDEYLSNVLSESGDLSDTYAAPRSVTDLQLRYAVTDRLQLLGEVQNLTEENLEFSRRFTTGDLLATRAERGRVVWLGFTWTP